MALKRFVMRYPRSQHLDDALCTNQSDAFGRDWPPLRNNIDDTLQGNSEGSSPSPGGQGWRLRR